MFCAEYVLRLETQITKFKINFGVWWVDLQDYEATVDFIIITIYSFGIFFYLFILFVWNRKRTHSISF